MKTAVPDKWEKKHNKYNNDLVWEREPVALPEHGGGHRSAVRGHLVKRLIQLEHCQNMFSHLVHEFFWGFEPRNLFSLHVGLYNLS